MRSMGILVRLLVSPLVLFGTLIVEVLIAMAIYMYLATNHVELFGELVRLARDGLNMTIDLMEEALPGLSNQAYATIAGEIGPKSFLLLVLGLLASGLWRLVVWIAKGAARSLSRYAAS